MRRLFKIVCSLAALVLLISTANAQQAGQDLHADDIQPWRVGAEIFVNSTLFEADFGDLSGGPFVTDEPGVGLSENVQKFEIISDANKYEFIDGQETTK